MCPSGGSVRWDRCVEMCGRTRVCAGSVGMCGGVPRYRVHQRGTSDDVLVWGEALKGGVQGRGEAEAQGW
eukprot:4231246-Pyramimonas_sp.AAC.1